MTTMDQEKLEELLSAYLDGELDDQQVKWVERLVQENENARGLLNDLQQTVQLVSTLPRQSAPASIMDDLQLHLERDELLGEPVSFEPDVRKSRISIKPILSIAAMVIVVLSATLWMARDHTPFPQRPGGDVLALAESKESTRLDKDYSGIENGKSRNRGQDARLTDGHALSTDRFASADINTKLEVGTNIHAIQMHPFSNETLRLKIKAKNTKERNALSTRLVTHFSNRQLKDISKVARYTKVKPSDGGFYYQGEPKINFTQPDQTQILVRIPVREIDRLLDEISQTEDIDDRVAVAAGPLIFRGLGQTRSTLQRLVSFDAESEKRSSEKKLSRTNKRRHSSKSSFRNESDHHKTNDEQTKKLFIDLLDVVGMDTAVVETMFEDSSEKTSAGVGKRDAVADHSDQSTTNVPMAISSLKKESQVHAENSSRSVLTRPRPSELRGNVQEPYVTFIIELQIEKPKPQPPHKTTRPTRPKPPVKKSIPKSNAQ